MKTQVQQQTAASLRSPHVGGVRKIAAAVGALCALFAVLAFSVSPALAEAECSACKSWWGLTASALPTNLHSGVAKDEVQEIVVSPENKAFQLKVSGTAVERFESSPYPFGKFPHATAANVQAALESESAYGSGNVVVTGQGPEGLPPLMVTTVNKEADGPVPPVEIGANIPGGTAEAKVVTPGRGDGQIVAFAENLGDTDVDGAANPLTIADKVPPGMVATAVEGFYTKTTPEGKIGKTENVALKCSIATITCSFSEELPPYEPIEMVVSVKVEEGAPSGMDNEVTITGGDAPATSARQPITVSGAPAQFGVSSYGLELEDESGMRDTQVGSHPFQLTNTIALNQTTDPRKPPAPVKDLRFDLPPGLIGNPTPLPQCTDLEFDTPTGGGANACPRDTAIGVASSTISLNGVSTFPVPLFNLVPARGEPARFGFEVSGNPVILDTSVRTGGDYGVTVSVNSVTESVGFLSSRVTVWGVPGDPRHDASRGWECIGAGRDRVETTAPCTPLGQAHPPPFLTLPTSCAGALQTSVQTDSWAQPGDLLAPLSPFEPLQSLDGCNRLQFSPEIKVAPDVQEASKPSGLTVDVHVPQEGQLNSAGLAQSNIKDIAVKLPAGVAVNPSSADGLETCSERLVGFTGFGEFAGESGVSHPLFSPYLPGSIAALAAGDNEPLQPGQNFCADASKIGEVTIKTPLLLNPLKGFVYLAGQEANPFNSVVALYVVAEDPVSGSLVKLPGEVQLCQIPGEVLAGMTCEVAGQLVSTFENTPQLAFEDAELHFFGGERAPLTSPTHCGTYTTEAMFTPWSGNPPVRSTSSFEINSGPNHSPCVYPGQALPFNPTLTGGATNIQAGAFSPFTLTMSRLPGEQNLQSVEAKLPPGLSGILSNVELCPEPQANAGACGPNSLIGETTVSVGVGGSPFSVKGGKFFLTGPYNGTGGCTVGSPGCAPFGITFEVPAKAGPFDFAKTARNHPACDCVLVRGKIEIDPHTSAITIVSNPPGTPDSIPTHLEGIPLEIQHVNAITTRSDFQFNPTNCNKMAVTGTIHSSEGGTGTINVPFQVTNCATLGFAPKFAVSTSGKTSKANGASLSVKLTYPKAAFGSQANIRSVKVDLPKQLPSRLTTLQKACTAHQFESNPAGCPAASIVGHAKATTPLLPVPVEGPAYFVSHGGEAFPSLILVLQGYGVTVDLVGTTFISKAGITSSTFKTVPDVPVGSFELTLPQGKFSALTANGSLCQPTSTKTVRKRVTKRVHGRVIHVERTVKQTVTKPLSMPTGFVAQNGAQFSQTTKIAVTGCSKKKAKKAKKTSSTHHGKGKATKKK